MRGGLSGAFYVETSNVYFSNTDGILSDRRLNDFDDWEEEHSPRRLGRSSFIAQDNIGSLGSGFVYGTT